MFFELPDLFTGLDMVFFDTTSIYFEGKVWKTPGQKGHSRDHRPDLNQMMVRALQARKDAQDRHAIIDSLQDRIKTNSQGLIGNKGYRKYLKIDRGSVSIHRDKMEHDPGSSGKWALIATTNFSANQVAIKYKELSQMEQVFRDIKIHLGNPTLYHQRDDKIRGHVF